MSVPRFDVVILGGGSAGEAVQRALPGRRIAVVEAQRVGGECPYTACVPSKALLRAAHLRGMLRRAHTLGAVSHALTLDDDRVAFAAAVARRDELTQKGDDSRKARELQRSAELVRGHGRVSEPGTVAVERGSGEIDLIEYDDLVLATGSVPAPAPIPGLSGLPTWSSDEALVSEELPRSLAILGGGPVGCELAQIYAGFGASVTLIEHNPQLLPSEDAWLAGALAEELRRWGVDVRTGAQVVSTSSADRGAHLDLSDGDHVEVDRILIATGRQPNVDGLGLGNLGVRAESAGIAVDEHCRVVGADRVWAAGDVTGIAPFTHVANYQGQLVAANIRGEVRSADYRAIPRVVYTEPPVAVVGRTLGQAEGGPTEVAVESFAFGDTVRAHIDGDEFGEIRLISDQTTGLIVGAGAIGAAADELINVAALAIRADVPTSLFAETVRPFPTNSEVYNRPANLLAKRRAAGRKAQR